MGAGCSCITVKAESRSVTEEEDETNISPVLTKQSSTNQSKSLSSIIQQPENTISTKRTIYVFYNGTKLPISFYPGTKTKDLKSTILKGFRLPESMPSITFLDEDGQILVLSSYIDDGASVFMSHLPDTYLTSETTKINNQVDNIKPVNIKVELLESNQKPLINEKEKSSSSSISSSYDFFTSNSTSESSISKLGEKEKKEPIIIQRKNNENFNCHNRIFKSFLYFILFQKFKEEVTIGDVPKEILLSIVKIFSNILSLEYVSWNKFESRSIVVSGLNDRDIKPLGAWPHSAITTNGITEVGEISKWSLSFKGCPGMYFHFGVIFGDEKGLLSFNPHISLLPSFRGEEDTLFDVIIDFSPKFKKTNNTNNNSQNNDLVSTNDGQGMYLVQQPENKCLYFSSFGGKTPNKDKPLHFAIWTKAHQSRATILDFSSGFDIKLPTNILQKVEFSHKFLQF